MNMYKLYENKICKLLKNISTQENKKIITVANEFFKTYKKNGMIYLFGTGHSHMIAEEGHFRAGGFAPICPILHSSLMLHENTNLSSVLERTDGIATNILEKYSIQAKDILVIFSNSGVNHAPIEAAYYAKKIKCKTVGVSSESYANLAKKSKYKKKTIYCC